ncbi:hypothetical protein P8A21_40335 (plasmid) [Streptomyces poriferorum]|uniref:hypothetical protein n=1 Tax=Streptomyces poriferorum TaxID=2798799 RepID=UPI00273F1F33|nr:hypothetical protein [Streptomyces sp. Alt1]WLQ53780.1 hypothetical protein P8A21_40335 [Streptomyces sp. Alt1]
MKKRSTIKLPRIAPAQQAAPTDKLATAKPEPKPDARARGTVVFRTGFYPPAD